MALRDSTGLLCGTCLAAVLAGCGSPWMVFEDDTSAGDEADDGDDPGPAGSGPTTPADPTTTGDPPPADSTSDATTTTTATADETSTSTGAADETTGDPPDQTTGNTGGTDAPLDGACPIEHLACDGDSNDPLHALGLNCTIKGDPYVADVNAVAITNIEFMAAPAMFGKQAWQVARSYGTHKQANKPFWGPREGDKVLLISSGLLPAPNGQGAVVIADNSVYNDVAFGDPWDSDSLPPPMSAAKGSPDPAGFVDCDGVNDCSNTVHNQWLLGGKDPEDKLWFKFEVTAPPGTFGYSFDFAFFSAEFPEFVDSAYNDVFMVWQASEAYTGNVTFIDGRPVTVTALWPIDYQGECDFDDDDCVGNDPHLAGTGYSADGGATGWYKATGGVQPGETFLLSFAIFDMADSSYDTTAILDNWRWDCQGCVANEVDSCGIDKQ